MSRGPRGQQARPVSGRWTDWVQEERSDSADDVGVMRRIHELINFLDRAPIPRRPRGILGRERARRDPSEGRVVPALDVFRYVRKIERAAEEEREWTDRTTPTIGHLIALAIAYEADAVFTGDASGPDLSSEPITVKQGSWMMNHQEPSMVIIDRKGESGVFCAQGVQIGDQLYKWFVQRRAIAEILGGEMEVSGITVGELSGMKNLLRNIAGY